MSQVTVKVTAEELFMGNWSADADISVTFELCAPEQATWDYPGSPGTVELLEWDIDEYNIYDANGKLVFKSNNNEFVVYLNDPEKAVSYKHNRTNYKLGTPQWVRDAVAKWVDENEESLIEDACEETTAMAEDWRY